MVFSDSMAPGSILPLKEVDGFPINQKPGIVLGSPKEIKKRWFPPRELIILSENWSFLANCNWQNMARTQVSALPYSCQKRAISQWQDEYYTWLEVIWRLHGVTILILGSEGHTACCWVLTRCVEGMVVGAKAKRGKASEQIQQTLSLVCVT